MPRARRRRKRTAVKRTVARGLLLAATVIVAGILVVGSVVEIHAQSGQYRSSIAAGYGALASRSVDASNQTGGQLAALMLQAPSLGNGHFAATSIPKTARAVLQQGLDQAADDTTTQAAETAHLVPPSPTDDVSAQLTRVMNDRATAVANLRSAIDQMLGMTPLPVAGAPPSTEASTAAPLISIDQATSALTAAGVLLQQADDRYRLLTAELRDKGITIHLPTSAWVPLPFDKAPLSGAELGASAASLDDSAAMRPFHDLIISAVGLSPPAVSTGGAGLLGAGCGKPQSIVPGSAPTLLPPTNTLTAAVAITNCGTVTESGVVVTESVALTDPAGATLPPIAARGATSRAVVTVRSGSSAAPALKSLPVAGGHTYTLTLSIGISANQLDRTATTQRFLVQIAG